MKNLKVCIVALLALSSSAFAQETQTRVVDEVVAQVNDGVITLSRIKREMKDAVDSFVQQGKTKEEAEKIVEEKRGELIAGLINEELLMQKAKEVGLDKDVEAMVNQRLTELMKQYNLKTVEALNAEMEKSGTNPDDFRASMRKQYTRERIIQQDVQSRVYWGFNGKELKDYYEANRSKFTQPETVSFSELFLGFAGRDETAVRDKAKQLYSQLKGGADWSKIVQENGDPGVITQGKNSAEKLRVADLSKLLATNLKGVKVGDYTEPFDGEQLGVIILKVTGREQASSQSVFDESAVRLAMMQERFPKAQEKYFADLRSNAYIKISEAYRPIVSPILFADERKSKAN